MTTAEPNSCNPVNTPWLSIFCYNSSGTDVNEFPGLGSGGRAAQAMVEENEHDDRRITYWQWTSGKAHGKPFNEELDVAALTDELKGRDDKGRLVRLPKGRGVLARIYTRLGGGDPVVKLFKVEKQAVLSILRGEEVEEFDLGENAGVMWPSWFRFHTENRVAMLRGPGGAGKGDMVQFINGLEPSLLEDAPHPGRASTVGLTALRSKRDAATIASTARAVTAAHFSLPADKTIDVSDSVVSEVTKLLKSELGEVSVKLIVTRSRGETSTKLQQEVGRIAQSKDLGNFRSAHMTYDSTTSTGVDLDMLEEQFSARVAVELGPAGMLTDRTCSEALDAAWKEAVDNLPSGVAIVQDGEE